MADTKLHSLCSVCAKLAFRLGAFIKDNRRPRNFHRSLRHLENSAKSGCHLCMLIFTSLASENGVGDYWRVEPDGPVKCVFRNNGEPHLLVTWNLVIRRFKLSSLPAPRVLRQPSIPAAIQDSSLLRDGAIEKSPKSPILFSQISKWLNSCLESHQNCSSDFPSILPTRVIDVGASEGLRDSHIFITNGQSGKYAALSYRWGTSPTITTTSETLASHISGMRMETLPKTLQDAILVSRALGLQYLWIDALCIIQDSPHDWAEQTGKMAGIYQDAHLTISADNAEGSDSGFLADRNLQAIRSCHHMGARISIHPDIQQVFDVINVGPLSQRGWILQERLFSRRIIHWSHLEVGWECREMQSTERDPQGQVDIEWLGSNARKMFASTIPPNLKLDKTSGLSEDSIPPNSTFQDIKSDIYDAWYRLVEEYSGRLLTYPDKDKLIALSSISKTYHKRYSRILGPEISYISGLWKDDLARGLSFNYGTGRMGRKQRGLPQATVCNLEDPLTWKYMPPSFSWTRGDGAVNWQNRLGTGYNIPEYNVEVRDVYNITTGGNPWGPVESCWIVLRGVVCSRELIRAVRDYRYHTDDDVTTFDRIQRESYIRLSVTLKPEGTYEQTWLMIHPVGEADEYRRIGVFSTFGDFSMNRTDKTNIKLI
ncbi:HET-domain-containing protein [Mollisia scopiformis]|uniref:HET-domain-containing protein n=1 Tax=Mollisia scopiformis TaxID=149040 RepID=A0A194XM13_MOLSC|nr:HET-domain-containing protein [Mollisia scopiformis]KUJ21218.1 HET-domain-containing protein [Mollisia scopiformis]